MKYEWHDDGAGWGLTGDGELVLTVLGCAGCHDSFTPLEDGVWLWQRHYDAPTEHMRMEPMRQFRGILHVAHGVVPHQGYRSMLEFAWRHYGHKLSPSMKAADLYRHGIAFFKSLWTREKSGFCAFNRGLQWYEDTCYA